MERVPSVRHRFSVMRRLVPAAYRWLTTGDVARAAHIGHSRIRGAHTSAQSRPIFVAGAIGRQLEGSVCAQLGRCVPPMQRNAPTQRPARIAWPIRAPAATHPQATSEVPAQREREFHGALEWCRVAWAASRHGYPRRPSSEGTDASTSVPGSPPPVPREPLRKGRLPSFMVAGGLTAGIRLPHGTAPRWGQQDHSAMFFVSDAPYAASANLFGKEVPNT